MKSANLVSGNQRLNHVDLYVNRIVLVFQAISSVP